MRNETKRRRGGRRGGVGIQRALRALALALALSAAIPGVPAGRAEPPAVRGAAPAPRTLTTPQVVERIQRLFLDPLQPYNGDYVRNVAVTEIRRNTQWHLDRVGKILGGRPALTKVEVEIPPGVPKLALTAPYAGEPYAGGFELRYPESGSIRTLTVVRWSGSGGSLRLYVDVMYDFYVRLVQQPGSPKLSPEIVFTRQDIKVAGNAGNMLSRLGLAKGMIQKPIRKGLDRSLALMLAMVKDEVPFNGVDLSLPFGGAAAAASPALGGNAGVVLPAAGACARPEDPDAARDLLPCELLHGTSQEDSRAYIDLVLVPDLLREGESATMRETLLKMRDTVLKTEPFAENRERLRIWALNPKLVGETRDGAGRFATRAPAGSQAAIYGMRYLATNLAGLAIATAVLPISQPDVIAVIAPTAQESSRSYTLSNLVMLGGSGGRRDDQARAYTLTHELGHTRAFGSLLDEYLDVGEEFERYQGDEPLSPNLTVERKRWEDLKDSNPAVGYVEGGRYRHGIYHAAEGCKMGEAESHPYCPVCLRAVRRAIASRLDESRFWLNARVTVDDALMLALDPTTAGAPALYLTGLGPRGASDLSRNCGRFSGPLNLPAEPCGLRVPLRGFRAGGSYRGTLTAVGRNGWFRAEACVRADQPGRLYLRVADGRFGGKALEKPRFEDPAELRTRGGSSRRYANPFGRVFSQKIDSDAGAGKVHVDLDGFGPAPEGASPACDGFDPESYLGK